MYQMKKKPDFKSLWSEAVKSAKDSGDARLAAVLENFINKKEYICRRLGIISSVDVYRVKRERKLASLSKKAR